MEVLEEIEGLDGIYKIEKVMIYKEFKVCNSCIVTKDYKGKIEIRKE